MKLEPAAIMRVNTKGSGLTPRSWAATRVIGNISTAAPLLVTSCEKPAAIRNMTKSIAWGLSPMPIDRQAPSSACAISAAAPVSCRARPMPRAVPMTMSTCQLMARRATVPVTHRVTTIATAAVNAATTGLIGTAVSITTSIARIASATHARSWRTGRVSSTLDTR